MGLRPTRTPKGGGGEEPIYSANLSLLNHRGTMTIANIGLKKLAKTTRALSRILEEEMR